MIDYSVRVSRRARRARIVVHPNMHVEVVLPEGVAQEHAAALVGEKRAWLERSLKRFSERAGELDASIHSTTPERICLAAIGQEFQVSYLSSESGQLRISENHGILEISCKTDAKAQVKSGLQCWLKGKAKSCFPSMLDELASRHGFNYQRLSIRLQKGRWGSCSHRGNISLNAKLLLLPERLCRYVMVHELAHLRHLNHSRDFWDVVAECDKNYCVHRKEMLHAASWTPSWAMHE